MKCLVSILMLVCSIPTLACGPEKEIETMAFANVTGSSDFKDIQIFIPSTDSEYGLNAVYLYNENRYYIRLEILPAPLYPNFQSTRFNLNSDMLDGMEIYFNYSKTSDGKIVMCGNVYQSELNSLVENERPEERVPEPYSN